MQKVKDIYQPILGRTLGIAIRSVVGINDPIQGGYADSWEDQERKEKNIFHSGELFGKDLRTQTKIRIVFRHPKINPSRIIVHFRRSRREGEPIVPMAAARLNEREPFGFTLEVNDKNPRGRNFIQPVYMSIKKPAGFEPLFVKILGKKNPTYIKVGIQESGDSKSRFLVVIASKVTEEEAPKHLQEI